MTTEFPAPPHLELVSHLSLPQLCGQLLVVGFEGTTVPASLLEAIESGLRGGVILFKRNLPDLETTFRICRDIIAAFPPEIAPFIAIDEEGGRVTRLPAPALTLPPMRVLGEIGDRDLTYRAASEIGRQLLAIGITCNFAPVLDVDSNPRNPIIGDRSFSSRAEVVAQHGISFAHGLINQGIMPCGKHFPGHGDTTLDSHLELPTVSRSQDVLQAVELLPFREAIGAGLPALMTAHVAYDALDPSGLPATLSRPILTELLRGELGFSQVLFSDDLEMKGILQGRAVGDAACDALRSGCDALLVCRHEALAEEALSSLVAAAESDPALSSQIVESNLRFHRARQRFAPRPQRTLEGLNYCLRSEDAQTLLLEIQRRSAR